MCVCVCVCVYLYAHVYVRRCLCVHTCLYTCLCAHACVYVVSYVCACKLCNLTQYRIQKAHTCHGSLEEATIQWPPTLWPTAMSGRLHLEASLIPMVLCNHTLIRAEETGQSTVKFFLPVHRDIPEDVSFISSTIQLASQ